MKEVLTVPFEFDTWPIEKRMQDDGFNLVLESITKQVMTSLLRELPGKNRGYYSSPVPKNLDEVNWGKFVGERFDKWLGEHSDEIVDEAAILLAMKGARKKKWRELVKELKEEEQDG